MVCEACLSELKAHVRRGLLSHGQWLAIALAEAKAAKARGPWERARRYWVRSGLKRFVHVALNMLLVFLLARRVSQAGSAAEPGETVVLVHGIKAGPWQMERIQGMLERSGYRVVNWGYDSTNLTIPEAAESLRAAVAAQDGRVHFVGFSMGALVARYYLARHSPPNAGRFVMIAPPNNGSELAHWLHRWGWGRFLWGNKGLKEMRTSDPFLKGVPEPSIPFGVIAGGIGFWPGVNPFMGRDNDGCVTVKSARLPGARDFIQVKGQHTMILFRKTTARQVLAFLKRGEFDRGQGRGGGTPQGL